MTNNDRCLKLWSYLEGSYIIYEIWTSFADTNVWGRCVSSSPSAWVCPPVPDGLWVSCSWAVSSLEAAAAMVNEGHRWSRFRKGSASQGVRRTQSSLKTEKINKNHTIRKGKSSAKKSIKWKDGIQRLRKNLPNTNKVILSMQNNITNKQNHGDVSWPEAQSCLQIKEFPLSSYSEVSLQGGWNARKFCEMKAQWYSTI